MKNARRPVHRGDIREEESFEKNVQQGANDTDAYADADKINEAESAPFYEEDTKEPEYVSETSAYASETPEEMERHYEERLAERRAERERRHRVRMRRARRNRIIALLVLLAVIALLAAGVRAAIGKLPLVHGSSAETAASAESSAADIAAYEETYEETTASAEEEKQALFAKADRLAAMYDYDAAVAALSESAYAEDPEAQSRIQGYQETAATMVAADNTQITHVFFHILVVDTDRAFTDDAQGKDFNQVMTTIPEFEKILQEMYDRGYVLVGLHDIAEVEAQEDGTEKMAQKKIMLPEGKKPFVMSQDDVCYYEYMEGRGCADKMVFDADGKLKLQYTDADGNVSIGDYDLVPILDKFVEEHPDFSYRGAKAIIAFTGYNGILGYRTDETYDAGSENYDPSNQANDHIEEDRATVKELTKALVEDGYELASHSWGHINFTNRSLEDLSRDTDRWERNVEPLLPEPCDIILFPFGADIGDWHPYSEDNEKYQMLKNAGFRYFCNVDSTQTWVQFGNDFMRQGRRNLDGYRLWRDYAGEDSKLSDLMDVQDVFDTRRPTPIEWN